MEVLSQNGIPEATKLSSPKAEDFKYIKCFDFALVGSHMTVKNGTKIIVVKYIYFIYICK